MKPIDFVVYESVGIEATKILFIGLLYPWQKYVNNTVLYGKEDNYELEVRGVFWTPEALTFSDVKLARNWRD